MARRRRRRRRLSGRRKAAFARSFVRGLSARHRRMLVSERPVSPRFNRFYGQDRRRMVFLTRDGGHIVPHRRF